MVSINTKKQSLITHAQLLSLLHYDPATGVFTWLVRPYKTRCVPGAVAGCFGGRYWNIWIGNRPYLAHRLAWFYVTGKWPERDVDHIDRNKQNNAWINLRLATPVQNGHNRSLAKTNKSGVTGVSFNTRSQKWIAIIRVGKSHIYVGRFVKLDDAAAAMAEARARLRIWPVDQREAA